MMPGVGVRMGNVVHLSGGIWGTEGNGSRGSGGELWRICCHSSACVILKVMLGGKGGLGIGVNV